MSYSYSTISLKKNSVKDQMINLDQVKLTGKTKRISFSCKFNISMLDIKNFQPNFNNLRIKDKTTNQNAPFILWR